MQNYHVSNSMIYHRQRSQFLKHNTTKSMVGLLPLAPHHDSLQYIHHVHLMQRSQNWGVTEIEKAGLISPHLQDFISRMNIMDS